MVLRAEILLEKRPHRFADLLALLDEEGPICLRVVPAQPLGAAAVRPVVIAGYRAAVVDEQRAVEEFRGIHVIDRAVAQRIRTVATSFASEHDVPNGRLSLHIARASLPRCLPYRWPELHEEELQTATTDEAVLSALWLRETSFHTLTEDFSLHPRIGA